jgi:hypothetical protein
MMIYLRDHEKQKLKQIAQQHGDSMSAWVRKCILEADLEPVEIGQHQLDLLWAQTHSRIIQIAIDLPQHESDSDISEYIETIVEAEIEPWGHRLICECKYKCIDAYELHLSLPFEPYPEDSALDLAMDIIYQDIKILLHKKINHRRLYRY